MKILLISTPSRRASMVPPLGLLQVAAILENLGHEPHIYDPLVPDANKDRYGKNIDDLISNFRPDIVGFGGIATSYGEARKYALYIRNFNHKLKQIAGGPLSSVSQLLLKEAGLDAVVHGEAEVSLPILLNVFENRADLRDVPGISFMADGTEIVRNKPAHQVDDLDSLPLPAYHYVNLPAYFRRYKKSITEFIESLDSKDHLKYIYDRVGEDDRWIEVMTSRGCTHRCLFCYRHMKGIRYFSADYVIKHIKYLNHNYGIRGFQFSDELFNGDISRVYEICDAIVRYGLDIFYTIGGARVDKVDEEMLLRLKQTGCVEINYGHESGSDTILKEYRKGVSSQQNRNITLLTTKKIGLICPVQIVIGAPAETDETIRETIQFLKDVDAYNHSLNYLIPLPETPIWDYVEKNQLIDNVGEYLNKVARFGGQPIINLTQASNAKWYNWGYKIRAALQIHYIRKKGFNLKKIFRLFRLMVIIALPYRMKVKIIGLLRNRT